jgi:hypothetical protein
VGEGVLGSAANGEEQWSRPLAMADLLRVAEELEVLADDDGAPILEASLRDGSGLRGARTVAALRAESDAEAEDDIQSIKIGLGPVRTAVTWLNWEKRPSLDNPKAIASIPKTGSLATRFLMTYAASAGSAGMRWRRWVISNERMKSLRGP